MRILNAYLEDERTIVVVFRDPVTGSVRGRRVPAEWVSFLRASAVKPEYERDLRQSTFVRSIRRDGEFLRIAWTDRISRKRMTEDARSPIVQQGLEVFEGDVHPVRRWMVDNLADVDRPHACFLDIETDSRVPFARKEDARILSWVIVDVETGKPVTGLLEHDTDQDEKRLLEELWRELAKYSQVFAWGSSFGDTFDFVMIFARSRLRGISIDARRWLWADYLQVFETLNTAAESGEEKASMKLEDIGAAILGTGKMPTPQHVIDAFGDHPMGSMTWELWSMGGPHRQTLVEYMIRDGVMLYGIEKKTGFAALFQTLCEACFVFGETSGLAPTRQVDGFLLRIGAERGHRFPTKKFVEGEKYKGAFVMPPKCRGIEQNVHVGDFKSLYPTIILSFNMSPDTRAPMVPVNGPIPDGFCRAPVTGVAFRLDQDGILTVAVRELLRLRKKWSELKASLPPGTPEWLHAHRMATAYKVAVNAFYGVIGTPSSRFYDKAVAQSIAQAGVWLIKATIEAAEARGMRAVYTDTDSCFVTGATRSEFTEFVAWCNAELYPVMLKKQGVVENHVKLAYEKEFRRIIFPLKADGEVSKKRYAASYVHYGGKDATEDSKPEIKGVEYMRGDSLRIARKLQARILDLFVGGLKLERDAPTLDVARYHELLAKVRRYVLEKPTLDVSEVKLSKGLAKPLDEYVAKTKDDGSAGTDNTHVAVAKILRDRGREVRQGTRIEYVVMDGAVSPMKVIPAEDYVGECDRHYLWEKQIFPPVERLLVAGFPEVDWEPWARSRPPKPRASAKVADEQGALPGVDLAPAKQTALFVGPTPIAKSLQSKRRGKRARGISAAHGENDAAATEREEDRAEADDGRSADAVGCPADHELRADDDIPY